MKNRAYLQISFAWLFAIVVGAFILFLAIFAVTKLISVEQTILDAKAGKEIGVLLNPLEMGFQSAESVPLILPVETRIYNKCGDAGMFGRQIIKISQKSFNKWTETDIDVGFSNKYVFSEKYVEGERFNLFSKPFDFPFKVADLIYLTSSKDKYCFLNAPEDIEREISSLAQENLLLEGCQGADDVTQVCFGSGVDCGIKVNYNIKYVEKNGERMYFEGDALMYAAVFATPEIYECHLKRLMQRVKSLALLYQDKAKFISRTGCDSNLNLLGLINAVNGLDSSANLNAINSVYVEDIKSKNNFAECKLW